MPQLEKEIDATSPQEFEESGIEAETIRQMFEDLQKAESVADFFDSIKAEPEKYMRMMNMSGMNKEQFLKLIEQQEQQFYSFLKDVKTDPQTFIELFKNTPNTFMSQLKGNQEQIDKFIRLYELNPNIENRVFVYYQMDKYITVSVYSLLVMLTFGAIGLFISLLMKRGKSISTIAIGITLGAYFINVISNMTQQANMIGYLSPFKFSDTNITSAGYGFEWWRLLYFIGLSLILFVASAVIYRRKDILI
jgi:preprotein translocase subunit Sss1